MGFETPKLFSAMTKWYITTNIKILTQWINLSAINKKEKFVWVLNIIQLVTYEDNMFVPQKNR